MNPLLWRLAICSAIALGGLLVGMAASRAHYRPIVADMKEKAAIERQAAAEAVIKSVQENDQLKTTLGVQHAKNKAAVDDLFRGLAGARVQLPATSCAASGAPDTAAGSGSSVTRDRALLENTQWELDAFTERLAEEAQYADTVIENCRVMKLYLLEQAR